MICKICSHEAKDLTRHIVLVHGMEPQDYKEKYGDIVDSSVVEKRNKTRLMKYGDPHYTNREATRVAFSQYEGGNPLSDPAIKERIRKTNIKRYGTPHFVNKNKRIETNLKKYGVPHSCMAKSVIEKRKKTSLMRYGRVINNIPKPTPLPEDIDKLKDLFYDNVTIKDMAKTFNVSSLIMSSWIKRLNLKRVKKEIDYDNLLESFYPKYHDNMIDDLQFFRIIMNFIYQKTKSMSRETIKKIHNFPVSVSLIEKEYGSWNNFLVACGFKPAYQAKSPSERVQEYFDACFKEQKVLSFSGYEKSTGNQAGRLKRLFNKGKKYHHLKQELFDVALDSQAQKKFLSKLS